jgi:FkbM family methyltransferase
MAGVRRRLGRLLRAHVYGRRRYETLFALMHRYALAGLYGVGDTFNGSGEAGVLARLADVLPPNPLVVDVGANLGAYARLVLDHFPSATVHCFEPVAATFSKLEGALGTESGVQLHRVALGDEDGMATLYSSGLAGDNLASLHPNRSEGRTEEAVQVRRLDAVAAEVGITRIDFLKVDAEGHDLFVLRGAGSLLESLRAVQFEFSDANVASRTFLRDFYDLLAGRFDLYRILRDGILPLGPYRSTLEVFVPANYLALVRDDGSSAVAAS